ncbi:hypothetical protein BDV40DRAFT_258686 [Aspergillus tamarii]|uniref:Uncharacterized protein n=1 Tax=Aspergillus tamarii TaxID=41984 RepID=A0A5N6V610_ASPTM|nr:hypothetical protein BDV40DRAFT_258686 [Aspergillus tamarii]
MKRRSQAHSPSETHIHTSARRAAAAPHGKVQVKSGRMRAQFTSDAGGLRRSRNACHWFHAEPLIRQLLSVFLILLESLWSDRRCPTVCGDACQLEGGGTSIHAAFLRLAAIKLLRSWVNLFLFFYFLFQWSDLQVGSYPGRLL